MKLTFDRQRLEAAAWTFGEVFLVTIAPAVATLHVGDWGALGGVAAAAAMSALGAALSYLKSTVVRNLGTQDTIFLSDPSKTEEAAG